jgi:hypothetical protein
MFPALEKKYAKEKLSVIEAQHRAHEISFGPIVFQASRLMVKFGIMQMLVDAKTGLAMDEIVERTRLPRYAVQVLLESSLTAGTVLYADNRFTASKVGWFLLSNPMVQTNMDFTHEVNYLGWYHLEEALLKGKPEGLKVFGDWNTIYEGLSELPAEAQRSWFGFDHFYSDHSFDEALKIVFAHHPRTLLDVGGNTGRWALRCVDYDEDVTVTIMDLPQQLEMMKKHTAGQKGAERILGYGANLLDEKEVFPGSMSAIWMSQFLDCFSETEVTSILRRAAASMDENTSLFIMETFWDRQPFETAAFCLTQISLYFTVMANGNSKMYHSEDMIRCIEAAGLSVSEIHDGLSGGHSIVVCKKS